MNGTPPTSDTVPINPKEPHMEIPATPVSSPSGSIHSFASMSLTEEMQPGVSNPPVGFETRFNIGESDVHPMGSFHGQNPNQGSLIGPNHTGFGPSVNNPYAGVSGDGFPDSTGGFARFDPIGPPGLSREPDADHLRPPGSMGDGGFGGSFQ